LAEPAIEVFTASDGYVWRYRRFRSSGGDTPLRPTLVGLHGIQSHGGWYLESCQKFADDGYAVVFLDRRGCGLNDRDRGDAPSFRRLLDDIGEYLVTLPRPRYLLAISWGGNLAVALQRRHPNACDGIVLIAPGLCPRVGPDIGQRLRIIFARLVAPRRTFPIPLNDPGLFTANVERQHFIRNDRLMLRRASARMLFESSRLDVYLRFASRCVTVPVLLLFAEHDLIIDNAATRRMVERFPATDRTTIEYAGAHHTLEFEPGGPPFDDDVLKWLAERSPNR
jgi:alpha-beta hydrolase superfamily lysophospholipase